MNHINQYAYHVIAMKQTILERDSNVNSTLVTLLLVGLFYHTNIAPGCFSSTDKVTKYKAVDNMVVDWHIR